MTNKKIEYVWDPKSGQLDKVEVESELQFSQLEALTQESPIVSPTTRFSIQWGSGKPGENGSETIERNLFEKLGFKNPKIIFIPFHTIVGSDNDWTRFLSIYKPLTKKKIELIRLDPGNPPVDLKKFYQQFEDADLIVLGSGVVEPFMELLHLIQFGQKLKRWQQEGKIVYGYSAGTIAIGEIYLHYFLGHEVLTHLFFAHQRSAKMADALRLELEEHLEEDTLEELDSLMEDVKKKGLNKIDSPFTTKTLGLMQAPTFKLVPEVVCLPHFGEYFLCTENHLRAVEREHPEWKNVGIPNGMALIHSIDKENNLTTEVFGHNPNVSVTMIGKEDELLRYNEGEILFSPTK